MTTLEVIQEWHTTDLIAACPRQVYLRRQGLTEPEYTTAIFRGQVAHKVLEKLHTSGEPWADFDLALAIRQGILAVSEMAVVEHRPLSESVKTNMEDLGKVVERHCRHYINRLWEYFSQCTLIGCELPVHYVLHHKKLKKPTEFSSHIDLLFRDPDGELSCWDWKWKEDSANMRWLGRNLQFALYNLCLTEGQVRVDAEFDIWETFNELIRFGYCDLARMKAYMKKCSVKVDGETVEYKKGDERPISVLVKTWTYSPDHEDTLKNDLALRVFMGENNLWPKMPDIDGCQYCESSRWCESYVHDKPGA